MRRKKSHIYKKVIGMKEFLEKTLRQNVIMMENNELYKKLPLVYRGRYDIFTVETNGVLWMAIQPRDDVGLVLLRRDRTCVEKMTGLNCAIFLDRTTFYIKEKLMEEGVGKDEAIFRLLKETIIASEAIRFEGDGYSEEWKQEAARRGLTNICHVPEALMHYVDNQSKSVLIGERIFNETELNSRLEVELEKYTMKVQIEGRVLGDLAINHIVPTAVTYQNRLLENLCKMKEIFSPEEFEVLSADRKELIREISHRVTSIKVLVREMTEARKVANHKDNYKERAFAYEEKVRPYLDQIRDHIDHLEMEVDDEIWPLPKYRELLFTK